MADTASKSGWRRAIHLAGAYAPVFTFAALFAFFALATDEFLAPANLQNILAQNAALAIMAVGVTFVLICAQIDLSIAAVAGLSAVVCAGLHAHIADAYPAWPAALQQGLPIAAALAVCAFLGFLNGVGTAWFGLPSFMMTLAMSLIANGMVMYLTRGTIFSREPEILGAVAFGTAPGGFPLILLPAIAALAAGFVTLRYTRFGRHAYTVGSNPVAAELSGVRAKGVLVATFTISGFTAGLAGLVFLGRAGSAQAGGTDSMLIECISAVVIGGTSLFGGQGGVANTVVGLLTFGILKNGLNHLDVDINAKVLITGVILLAALLLNVAVARLRERR